MRSLSTLGLAALLTVSSALLAQGTGSPQPASSPAASQPSATGAGSHSEPERVVHVCQRRDAERRSSESSVRPNDQAGDDPVKPNDPGIGAADKDGKAGDHEAGQAGQGQRKGRRRPTRFRRRARRWTRTSRRAVKRTWMRSGTDASDAAGWGTGTRRTGRSQRESSIRWRSRSRPT